jgi:hypothetical protein
MLWILCFALLQSIAVEVARSEEDEEDSSGDGHDQPFRSVLLEGCVFLRRARHPDNFLIFGWDASSGIFKQCVESTLMTVRLSTVEIKKWVKISKLIGVRSRV